MLESDRIEVLESDRIVLESDRIEVLESDRIEAIE